MFNHGEIIPHFRIEDFLRHRRRRRRELAEAVLGLIATFFIGFFAPVVLVLGSVFLLALGEWTTLQWVAPAAALTSWLALGVARLAGRAMSVCHPTVTTPTGDFRCFETGRARPFAVEMAFGLQPFPWLMRPVVAVWFLAHFAVGVVIAAAIHHWLGAALQRPEMWVAAVFPIVVHLAFTVAANVYLVLAIAAVNRSEQLIESVWRHRFTFDLLLTTAFAVYSLWT